jgi:magnesium transporter
VWLDPDSGVTLWVDLTAPSIPESLILSETFKFHPLSVEDALAEIHYPKIEPYDGYLYVILHRIDYEASRADCFSTQDVDFFVGPHYLVTVHGAPSRSITTLHESLARNGRVMQGGPVPLFHHLVDSLVEDYRPEVEQFEERLDQLEEAVFDDPTPELLRSILDNKRQVSALRRILAPERDLIARLARREFMDVSVEMAFKFRDVHDQLVRLADDAMILQDRLTALLDAHVTSVSNRLNQVMKVLTIVSTIFMPLSVISGLWGMNLLLPTLPGGEATQFWWIFVVMVAIVVTMLLFFRRLRWM